jgi:hypothetical protein
MAKRIAEGILDASFGKSTRYADAQFDISQAGKSHRLLKFVRNYLGNSHVLLILLLLEALLLALLRIPGDLGFDNFAFADTGDNLTANFLIGRGLLPGVDFGYHYGLLGLFVGRLWFGLFGATPVAYVASMWVCNGLIVWGIVRFVQFIDGPSIARIATIAMLPLAVSTDYQSFSAALEPLLLIHAMASQASGRRSHALALTAAAVFAKPAMGYFYGVVLIIFLLVRWYRFGSSFRLWIDDLWPAAAVTIALSTISASYFGIAPLLGTILPLTGAHAYIVEHFGFFQAGSLFWRPLHPTLGYYLESVAGFWIVATAVLFAGGVHVVFRLLRGARLNTTAEMVLSCALLHLLAIFVLWGNQFSFAKYLYILVLGLLAIASFGLGWRHIVIAVAFLVPFGKIGMAGINRLVPGHAPAIASSRTRPAAIDPGQIAQTAHTYSFWRSERPDPITAGLWATGAEREEWRKVLKLVRGQTTSMLMTDGSADLLFSEFMKPVGLHLDRALPLPGEFAAKLKQLRNSERIVVPPGEMGLLEVWPEIGALVSRHFDVLYQGEFFTVLGAKHSSMRHADAGPDSLDTLPAEGV